MSNDVRSTASTASMRTAGCSIGCWQPGTRKSRSMPVDSCLASSSGHNRVVRSGSAWVERGRRFGIWTHLLHHLVAVRLIDDAFAASSKVVRLDQKAGREPPHRVVFGGRDLDRFETVR